jgi:magnesium-transporting ATPase (P-type)
MASNSDSGDWHSMALDELRTRLETNLDTGLRRDQIAALRAKWGPNKLSSNEPIADKVLCLRDGAVAPIDAVDLLPGDIVEVRAGDKVPADIRILSASDLKVNNASLTGENMDVKLGPEAKHATIFEAENIARCGCTFTGGAGRGVVFATGNNTFFGQIASAMSRGPRASKRR